MMVMDDNPQIRSGTFEKDFANNPQRYFKLVAKYLQSSFRNLSCESQEEVVNDTLLRVLMHCGRWETVSDAYLISAARNLASTRYKSDAFIQQNEHGYEPGLIQEASTSEGDSLVTALALRDALEKVSSKRREIIILADVDKLSYDEIAEMLGVPVGTVRSRLSRGRNDLRHAFTS